MTPERWEDVKAAFSFVVGAGVDNIGHALPQACRGDPDLLVIVKALVDEHFRMRSTIASSTPRVLEAPPASALGGRFRIGARLGGGTFGDVYRAIDDTTRSAVALKILRSRDAVSLQYFKREFRSLADVHHRNIVRLYELIADDDRWMFSMELVEGVDFLQFVARQPLQQRPAALRQALGQVAAGVGELHNRQLLHRDLKPSNVLVTAAGRVVLLDFGLVRTLSNERQASVTFAGTLDYVAPEHVAGERVGEPSDWYAFGVMLYQVLTGDVPFRGDFLDVMRRKQFDRPVPPIEIAPETAPELNDLCLALLERNPASRASYADVVRVVQGARSVAVRDIRKQPFVGRIAPLGRLEAAYGSSENRPVLVHLCGPSGIGKTVLLREWLEHLRASSTALIFAGRCYEGQSVPYQALDDAIDHIAQYLRRLPRAQVDSLLPRNFALLARMFPVLDQFVSARLRPAPAFDTVQWRARALAALREMLGRLAERNRLVLVIDDLQWGDEDGCVALNDLLSAFDSPPMLTVLAYRSEDLDATPWLRNLREESAQSAHRDSIFLELGGLDGEETRALARSLLTHAANADELQQIVDASVGNPFLVHEIVRWVNTRGIDRALADQFSLDDVVRWRLDALGKESRRLLELLALAGQPTDVSILQAASGVGDVLAARDELIAARLVRSRVVRAREEFEVYHDRLRAAISSEIGEQARARGHRDLAQAFQAAGADPEMVATHLFHAGERQLGGRYALDAARRATDVLAFNKAARFFELALSTQALEPDVHRVVQRQLGDALSNAGRGFTAAGHYLAAARDAARSEQLALKQRAADELLHSGHIDQGLAIFDEILHQVGMKLPKRNGMLPVQLLLRRAVLRVRGLRWREPQVADLPREVLLTLDSCSSVATGLALVDIARGAVLQTTSLLLALRAGEPTRISRALAMEAGYRSTAGARAQENAEAILSMARELADRTGDARARALAAVMAAGCAWSTGRWEECYRRAQAAKELLRGRYERITWERDTAAIFEVDALRWLGRWAAMKTILPELLEDARGRGDLYAEAILQMHAGSCAELANDEPLRARAGLALLERWSNKGFHVEHLVETHNQVEIALYMGQGRRAFALITARWPALRRSFLLRVQNFRIQMRSLRARAALAAAADERAYAVKSALLRQAARDMRVIQSENTRWGDALAALIEGACEHCKGHSDRALASFGRAEVTARDAGMILHSAVARRSQGVLMRGEAGRALAAAADNELRAEAVKNPERLAAVIAPGVR